jgi:hypothetical protein
MILPLVNRIDLNEIALGLCVPKTYRIEGNWKQVKGKAKEKWAKLTTFSSICRATGAVAG